MRFFKKREQEPQGQPKEASELPVYQEEEDHEYFSPYNRARGMTERDMEHEQWLFYSRQHITDFHIKEERVVDAITSAGYICDPVINGYQIHKNDYYYTNVPLKHGVLTIFSGIEVVRHGIAIATPAQHQRDFAESGRQWRRKRGGYP